MNLNSGLNISFMLSVTPLPTLPLAEAALVFLGARHHRSKRKDSPISLAWFRPRGSQQSLVAWVDGGGGRRGFPMRNN